MKRREFLTTLGAAVGAAAFSRVAWAADLPNDVTIERIIRFDLASRRPKLVGKNSRLDVHGDSASDRMVRLVASDGTEGLGSCRASEEDLRPLLGRSVSELYSPEKRWVTVLGREDMPVWDLVGKLLQRPVYELLGGAGPQRVPVYDGSIYFADLLPQYESTWRDRFKEEIDMGMERGHRTFKIKIGRGNRWMPRAEGDRRDLEVVTLIRRHGGQEIRLGVDANDGYDLAGAKRFMEEGGDLDIAFTEEMFPETVENCLALKAFYGDRGWKTLLADGEGQREIEGFKPYIAAQAMDVLQGDMKHFGFADILREAEWARPQGIVIAPHNWGSLIGFYMQLHVGRAITNFYAAENDPLDTPVLVADGYKIADGVATVPAVPGFGLSLNEDAFASEVKVHFDLKAS
jgi:L-alanine-DL-glutamate epimerase-like enolase superfamily enzyme